MNRVDELTAMRDDQAREGRVGDAPVGVGPRRISCRACRVRLTWAACRVKYGRALRRGLSAAQAKAAGPRCQRCMTRYLRLTDGLPEAGERS